MLRPYVSPLKEDFKTLGRGFLMGGADVIPGVSGGTVALILGIYERLVAALSNVDRQLLVHLRRREWRAAAVHLDLRFLVALGSGIALGIGGLASVMHYLLDQHAVATWSFLFGVILASSLLVARRVERWSPGAIVAGVLGAAFAYWLVGQLPTTTIAPGYGYVFLCGAVAICAMILPGISGAFVLVLLGMYFHVTGVLKTTLAGNVTLDGLLTIFVFVAGCGVGLLSFSKFLRWLLSRHESWTMAALGGFMIGSLRKIWPLKDDATTPEYLRRLGLPAEEIAHFQADPAALEQKYRLLENHLPTAFTSEAALALGLILAGLLLVLALDYVSRAGEKGSAECGVRSAE
jgi:putative membrane protein